MKTNNFTKGMGFGILITVIGATCWGISGCFGQFLFQEKNITAEWLVAIRLLGAGLLLILMGFFRDGKNNISIFKNKKDTLNLVIFSFLGMLVCQYTYFAAIQYSNAGTATVLQSTSSIMILIVVCIKEKRIPNIVESIAIIGASIGVFLLATHGNINSLVITKLALIYGIGAAIGAVLYNMLATDILNKHGVYQVVGYGMLISGVAFNLLIRPWNYNISFDFEMILALLGVIIIGTAISFSCYLKGVSIIGPLKGSILGNIEPVVAIIVAVLFLNSSFDFIDFLGFTFILGTVIFLSLKRKDE